ncbi:MAG: hypothetical protein WA162_09295 [Thermodesulfobacteriota bacterium]
MKADKLIEKVLIKDIKNIQEKTFHYQSFFLMATGIEFLGACLDSNGLTRRGFARKRFQNAIERLFPEEYKEHASNLYKDLRCGLLHIGIPGKNFGLTQKNESMTYGTKHLEKYNGQIILISEEFYEHFKEACNTVIDRIQKGELNHPKLKEDIFMIPGEQISDSTGMSALMPTTSGCAPPDTFIRKM